MNFQALKYDRMNQSEPKVGMCATCEQQNGQMIPSKAPRSWLERTLRRSRWNVNHWYPRNTKAPEASNSAHVAGIARVITNRGPGLGGGQQESWCSTRIKKKCFISGERRKKGMGMEDHNGMGMLK